MPFSRLNTLDTGGRSGVSAGQAPAPDPAGGRVALPSRMLGPTVAWLFILFGVLVSGLRCNWYVLAFFLHLRHGHYVHSWASAG